MDKVATTQAERFDFAVSQLRAEVQNAASGKMTSEITLKVKTFMGSLESDCEVNVRKNRKIASQS